MNFNRLEEKVNRILQRELEEKVLSKFRLDIIKGCMNNSIYELDLSNLPVPLGTYTNFLDQREKYNCYCYLECPQTNKHRLFISSADNIKGLYEYVKNFKSQNGEYA